MYLIADSLLKLARNSLPRSRGRPDQAALRRAISTSYYAVFHKLIEKSVDEIARKQDEPLRSAIARSFDHGVMKSFARAIASGQPPKVTTRVFKQIPPELRVLAAAFASLQEERHVADYDVSVLFDLARAKAAINDAQQVFRLLGSLSAEGRHFLTLLPMAGNLKNR